MDDTLSDEERIARADENHVESFRLLARATAGGEVLDFGGVTIAATGAPAPMFNVAFVRRPDAGKEVERAVAWLRSRDLPFLVRYCVPVGPETSEWMVSLGLKEGSQLPGMTLPNSVALPAAHGELEILTARDAIVLQQHADICASSFATAPAIVDQVFSSAVLELLDVELYVGRIDGVAVTASALFLNNGVAGVYNVATMASHRRAGLGEAMTWHAVKRGRSLGCRFSALQASPMGMPVYERMGYLPANTYRSFSHAGPNVG